MKPVYIGIDPAFRKDGFAICIIDETKEARFKIFKSFLYFLDWLGEAPENAVVCVENSNLVNATFYTHKDRKGRLYTLAQARRMRGLIPLNKNELAKASRNVGANQAASQYTAEACRKHWPDSQVFEVTPAKKGKKWTNVEFVSVVRQEGHHVTEYKGNKNEQDKRDAYKLALLGKKLFSFQGAKIRV